MSSLAHVIRSTVYERISKSPAFSVLIDETTDVATISQLIIYFRHLDEGKPKTSYGGIIEVPNGRAQTIFDKTVAFLEIKEFEWREKCEVLGVTARQ